MLETFQFEIGTYLRTSQPQKKFTGPYIKKKSVIASITGNLKSLHVIYQLLTNKRCIGTSA